jgi:hypothetical protein
MNKRILMNKIIALFCLSISFLNSTMVTGPYIYKEEKEQAATARARELGLTVDTNIDQKAREILDNRYAESFWNMYDELECSYAASKKSLKILTGSIVLGACTALSYTALGYINPTFTTAQAASLLTTGTISGLGLGASMAELYDQNFLGKFDKYLCNKHQPVSLAPHIARQLIAKITQKRKVTDQTYITKRVLARLTTMASNTQPIYDQQYEFELKHIQDFLSRLQAWYIAQQSEPEQNR